MFFWILAIPFALLGLIFWAMQSYNDRNDVRNDNGWALLAWLMPIAIVITLGIGLLVSMDGRSGQINDALELQKIAKVEKIQQAQRDLLVKDFANILLDMYPKYEKDIYSKIEPGKLDLYMVKYPELKASETAIELVKQTRSLQQTILEQQLKRADTVKNMQFRMVDPWLFHFMIPDVQVEK